MPKDFKPIDTVHSVACGVDIHKNFLIAVICDESTLGEPIFKKKRFSLFKKDLLDFRDWLLEHKCLHVCMESTGKYWIPAWNILEPVIEEVRIVNPKWVKQVKGEKDDQKDATMICNKYRHGETKASYIPEKKIRDARLLTRSRTKITQQITALTNRINNQLFCNNYRLDMVFSSTKTKSARKIINLIISDTPYTDIDILNCVNKRCSATPEEILKAVDGQKFSEGELFMLRHLVEERDQLEEQEKKLDIEISKLLDEDYREQLQAIQTVPGISKRSSQNILAEIGADMGFFLTPSRLARWAGLAQDRNESADRKYSNRIGRGGKYLKPIMVECAWAAVRSKHPYYRSKFNNISSRRGHKRALIAIARKMLVSIWAILHYGTEWAPLDMNKNGCPRELDIRKSEQKLNVAISELLSLGQSKQEVVNNIIEMVQAT